MGKKLGRILSPNLESHLKRKRGHHLNSLISLSDSGDSTSKPISLKTSDTPSATVIDRAFDLETTRWYDSQSPTPTPSIPPTYNIARQSQSGNPTFTIFFLLIIIFCMFTSSPSFFKRCNPRHRRRRRRAREAAIAAEEAAMTALVENALEHSIAENRAFHGMTVPERMDLIKNVVRIEKVISLPMSRRSSESSIASFTDQSKQPSQTSILGGEPQDQVKLGNSVSPSQPLSSELSPPEQYKHPSSTEDNNTNNNHRTLKKNGIPNSDTCAICLLEYEKGDEICWSHHKKCFHAFHFDCMTEWLLRHNECPCCRNDYLNIGGSCEDDNIENIYIDNIEDRQRANNDLDDYPHGMQVFYDRLSHLVRIHSNLRTIDEDRGNNNRHNSQSNNAEPLVSSPLREPNVTTTSDDNNQNEFTTEVNEMNDADSSNGMVTVEIDRISNSSQTNAEPRVSSALIGTDLATTSDDNNQNEFTTEVNETNDAVVLNDMVSVEIDRISNSSQTDNAEPLASAALIESNVIMTSDDNSQNELTTELNETNDADGLNDAVSVEIDRIGTSTNDNNENSSTEGNIDNNSYVNERSELELAISEDLDSNRGHKESFAGSVEMDDDVTIDMDLYLESSTDIYEPNNLPAGIFSRESAQETVTHERVITSSVNEDDSEVTNITTEQNFCETNPMSTTSDKIEHERDDDELGVLKRSKMDDFNPKSSTTYEHLKCPNDTEQYDKVTTSSSDLSKEIDNGNYVLANDSNDTLKEDDVHMSTCDIRKDIITDRDYMTQTNPTPTHFENLVSKGNNIGAHSFGEEKGLQRSVIFDNVMQEEKGNVLESSQAFQNESYCISDSIHSQNLNGEKVVSTPNDTAEESEINTLVSGT